MSNGVTDCADKNSAKMGQLQNLYTSRLYNSFTKTQSDKLSMVNNNSNQKASDEETLDSTSFYKESTPFLNKPLLC